MRGISKFLSVPSLLCLAPFSAHALVFTAEAAFQAAAGGVVVEDFESYNLFDPVAALPGLHLTFSPLSNGSPPTAYDQSRGGVTHSGNRTLANNDKLNLPALGPMEIVADPGTVFKAFGYWNVGGDDTTSLTLLDANDDVIESAIVADTNGPNIYQPSFIGIIGATDAVHAVIAPVLGNGWFTIDDIQVDSASVEAATSIPAPGSLAILAGAFYWFRRRQDGERVQLLGRGRHGRRSRASRRTWCHHRQRSGQCRG